MTTPFFQNRCVQDLAWVIHSPPLISGEIAGTHWWGNEFFQREYADCQPMLHQLDTDPKPLQTAINSAKSHRLGHYFEALVAYWFNISPNYELLLSNHQLRTSEKTLGELDFLLQEKASRKVIHLEVSVKFYLGFGDLNDMSNWHGPGLKDRLDRKFQHLLTHQTQLAHKYPELMPHKVDEAACLMKGRLFYPIDAEPATFTDQNHLHGHWYQIPLHTPLTEHPSLYLGKQNWLAETRPDNSEVHSPLPAHVGEAMLYAHHNNVNETERFFLLPQGFWDQVQTNNKNENT
ncbi:MAG: DUF1853 family protein [Thiolinea sp.]